MRHIRQVEHPFRNRSLNIGLVTPETHRQLSVYVGRPTAIREQDYDTESPELDIEEDAELTQMAQALEPHNPNIHFSAAIDCLRERVALCRSASSTLR